jgi:hypothetical protein
MPGMLYQYLSYDHVRLEDLPQRAVAKQGVINMEPYEDLSLSANLCAMLLRFVRPALFAGSSRHPDLWCSSVLDSLFPRFRGNGNEYV